MMQFGDLLAPEFQQLILAQMLRDPIFTARARAILRPTYFNATVHAMICEALFAFWDTHHTLPALPSLRIAVQKQVEDAALGAHYSRVVDTLAAVPAADLDRAWLGEQLAWFAQRAEAAVAIDAAYRALRTFDVDALTTQLQTIQQIPSTFLDTGLRLRRDYPLALLEDDRMRYHLGWPVLDDCMRGGLREGEMATIMLPTKRGKSLILSNWGIRFMKMGFNVAHYSLEMYSDDVLRRYTSACADVPTNTMQDHRGKVMQTFQEFHEWTQGDVVIKDLPGGSTTVATIDAHLTMLEVTGKRHIVIVDYADLMLDQGGRVPEWQQLHANYVHLRQLAKQHRVPIITAQQTNAPGFHPKGGRLGLEHQSGSTRKGFVVDYMWAGNQDDDEYAAGVLWMESLLARHAAKHQKTYWRVFYDSGLMEPIEYIEYQTILEAAKTAQAPF